MSYFSLIFFFVNNRNKRKQIDEVNARCLATLPKDRIRRRHGPILGVLEKLLHYKRGKKATKEPSCSNKIYRYFGSTKKVSRSTKKEIESLMTLRTKQKEPKEAPTLISINTHKQRSCASGLSFLFGDLLLPECEENMA